MCRLGQFGSLMLCNVTLVNEREVYYQVYKGMGVVELSFIVAQYFCIFCPYV